MTVTNDELRSTLRLWGSGVSIVTTALTTTDDTGTLTVERAGMTVSAFSSLSIDPPLILICLAKDASAVPLIQQAGCFAVSFLRADQVAISDHFAGRTGLGNHEERFAIADFFTVETESPILRDSLAWLDCRVDAMHEGGTHWIIVGAVIATGQGDAGHEPLFYFNRGYHRPSLIP